MKKNLLNIIMSIVMAAFSFSTSAAQTEKKNGHFQKQEKVFATISKVEADTSFLLSRLPTPAYSFESNVLKISKPTPQPAMVLQMQRIAIENEVEQASSFPLNGDIKKSVSKQLYIAESALREAISHSSFIMH